MEFGLESIVSSPGTNFVQGQVTLSKTRALSACWCQPMLVDWFGDPLGVRVSYENFMEWISGNNLEDSYIESSLTQEEFRPHRPCSGIHLAPWQQTEGFEQTWAGWPNGGQACIGGALRNWAFAGTVVQRNPVYDMTLLGLISQPTCLLAGWGAGDKAV